MLKRMIRNRLTAFETRFGYDVTYARELLASDLGAFMAYARLDRLSRYRKDVPREVYYAAKLPAVVEEDCGPCTQLTVAMALADGVDPRTIATILEGIEAVMSPEVRLGYQFARATLAHDVAADPLRDEIVRRWGPRALASLAFGIAAGRVFPTIKYALGHGKACARIDVAGEPVMPLRSSVTPAAVLRALS